MNNALMQLLRTSPYSYTIFSTNQTFYQLQILKNKTLIETEDTREKKSFRHSVALLKMIFKFLSTSGVRTEYRVSQWWCRRRVCETDAQPASSLLDEWPPKCVVVHEIAGQTLCEIPYRPPENELRPLRRLPRQEIYEWHYGRILLATSLFLGLAQPTQLYYDKK